MEFLWVPPALLQPFFSVQIILSLVLSEKHALSGIRHGSVLCALHPDYSDMRDVIMMILCWSMHVKQKNLLWRFPSKMDFLTVLWQRG